MALTPAQIVQTLAPIVGRVGAAGAAGNLMQESSDRSNAPGGGLMQEQGTRWAGLVKYAQSRGLSPTSDAANLGYLIQDLKGPYADLAQQLRQAQSPGHAAVLFSNIYERPGTPMIQNRINYAQQAFGSKGQGLPALPNMSQSSSAQGSSPQTTSTTKNVFDQAGFNQANARYIAGNFLSQSEKSNPYGSDGPNPLLTSGLLTTKAPNPADYQKAQTTLQKIAGNTTLNQHPAVFNGNIKSAGYVNPLPGAKWERTDMGVDASMRNGAPIRAIGDSKVVAIRPFYKGQPKITFQFTSGPDKGRYYYIAEAINPNVRVGQTVRSGQTVGTYNINGTGLELGWDTAGGQTLAQATTGYSEGQQTTAGKSFRNFLNGLGAGAG